MDVSHPVQMAAETPAWVTKSDFTLIPHKYGPKPKPKSTATPVPADYPDSAPDFDETVPTPPSATPNGPRTLQDQAKADCDALEVQITKLIRIPPAPPGLVPRSLPQTCPLSLLRRQRVSEQLEEQPSATDTATNVQNSLQGVLDRLQQKYPEKQGHPVPTATPPPIVRHDPATAPSVLIPLSAICQHCGAINVLVKDPITDQTPQDLRVPK